MIPSGYRYRHTVSMDIFQKRLDSSRMESIYKTLTLISYQAAILIPL
jgi:hypothetical protein